MRVAALSLGVLLSVSLLQSISTATFPKNWSRCRQSDPDISKCLSKNVLDAIRKMENKGIPSLGVFSIDPLKVNEIKIIQGNNGPITLNLAFKNLNILGIAKSSFQQYDANLKEYKIFTNATTPSFKLVGDYEMDGRILLLPIQGKGKCEVTLDNLISEHYLTGEPYEVKGVKYMRLSKYRTTFKPEKVVSRFENLFNGDKALGDTMNRFMNDNWETIFKEMGPTLEDTFGELFKEMSNRIFTKIPFNEIFLP